MDAKNAPEESGSGSAWTPSGEYSWNHAAGWTITRYSVRGVRTYLLWDNEGKKYGPFLSAKDAQAEFDRRAPAATIEPAANETASEDSNDQ